MLWYNYENVFSKNKPDSESINIYNGIKEQNKSINYTKPVCIRSSKHYVHNFIIFLNLGNFAENIYNGKLSLKAGKIKQNNMEDMIIPIHIVENIRHTKQVLSFMQKNLKKKKKELLCLKVMYLHYRNNIHKIYMIRRG